MLTSTRVRRLGLPLAAALASGAVLAGCGGSSPTSEIKQTLNSYWRAGVTGDGTRACQLMTNEMRQGLARLSRDTKGGNGCAGYLTSSAKRQRVLGAGREPKLSIGKVTVSGDHATASITERFRPVRSAAPGATAQLTFMSRISLVRSGGRWLVGAHRAAPPRAHLFQTGDTLKSAIAKQFQVQDRWTPLP